MQTSTFSGIVKSYDPARGFGFIYGDQQKLTFFFHITAVKGPNPPSIGDKVSFSLKEKNGKLSANSVEVTVRKDLYGKQKTLDGFPCIRGGSISGFKLGRVIKNIKTSQCSSVDDAREELLREAKRLGADAVFNYVWHRESDLHNAALPGFVWAD